MGFLYFPVQIPKCLSFTSLLNLLSYFKSRFTVVFIYLGFLKTPEQDHSVEQAVHYVLVMDGICPSLVPIPVHVLTAQIKKRLPVVAYSDFLERCDVCEDDDDMCPVCLECIEKSHEIRELCNCSHVFHRGCLDRWVDEGQVTCPLCRSVLYPDPTKAEATGCRRDSWMMGMNNNLIGDDHAS